MAIKRVIARREVNSNPLAPKTERPGISVSEQFEEAVVVDVIVNNEHTSYAQDGYNVGSVKFRFINSNYFRPDETLNWAFPLDSNISEYPLINEIVYVFRSLNRFYYMKKFNIANRPTSQGYFGLNSDSQPMPNSSDSIRNFRAAAASPIKQSMDGSVKLGDYFQDKLKVYRLKHLEGDILYEGRHGQSIRFGSSYLDGITGNVQKKPFKSSLNDQSPNILIRVGPDPNAQKTVDSPYGLVIEDINKDASSVWITEDQIIPLVYSTQNSGIHRVSIQDFPNQLSGNQIVINSDRIVINSKKDKILGHSALGIHWTTLQDFTIDANRNHTTWTTGDRADRVVRNWRTTVGQIYNVTSQQDIVHIGGKNQFIGAGGRISLVGPKIHIGTNSSTSEPLVLGSTLRTFLDQLLSILAQEPIILVTSTPGSPSSQNPQRISQLQQLRAQYLGGGTTAKILSVDNFTTRTNEKSPDPRKISPYTEG